MIDEPRELLIFSCYSISVDRAVKEVMRASVIVCARKKRDECILTCIKSTTNAPLFKSKNNFLNVILIVHITNFGKYSKEC